MKYLLDTNTCIRHLNRRSEHVIARLEATDPRDIIVCSVVRAELFFGAAKSQVSEKTLDRQRKFVSQFESLPFDDKAAEFYGVERAQLEKRGVTIGLNDLLIASIALANQCIVVTHNVSEFSRVQNLLVEDWEL